MLGVIKAWHDPRNYSCANNEDIYKNCTCKRVVNRKPYRVVRVHDGKAPAGVKADIVVEVHPNGRLVFREAKRRRGYETTAGAVYYRIMAQEARVAAMAKKKARRRR